MFTRETVYITQSLRATIFISQFFVVFSQFLSLSHGVFLRALKLETHPFRFIVSTSLTKTSFWFSIVSRSMYSKNQNAIETVSLFISQRHPTTVFYKIS